MQKKALEVTPDELPTICFENGIRETKTARVPSPKMADETRAVLCCGGLKRGRFAFGGVASDE